MDHPFLYTDSMMSRLLLVWYSYLSDVVPVEEGEGLGLHNGGYIVQGLVGGLSILYTDPMISCLL